ncbi:MAG: hypothetical protein C5B55_04120 [Blastocatellia bacterium]|nr:MAG: hypothetical protein C5B55_04120 [Blastocatellia bacterium]
MRIAVSGSHCVGKTTLIDEFLRNHPHFTFEPEPYVTLVEEYGDEFSSMPSAQDFFRQLLFQVEQLTLHTVNGDVIFERSPFDFLAYILALRVLLRESISQALIEEVCHYCEAAIKQFDLIVFIPLDDCIEIPVEEDTALREEVNSQLVEIFEELHASDKATIVEARGSTTQRLRLVESFIER